jgi:REP element-mobilizing transposase RayT
MADSYAQIYVHVVFAVRNREALIREEYREPLQRYITGIVTNRRSKILAIYCMPDHTHLFIGLNPSGSLSDLVRDVKTGSTVFIKEQGWFKSRFYWQEGYGCFSYSRSQIPIVAHYIENQAEHHRKKTFREEYIEFLKKYEVEYNEKHLFEWFH